MSDFLQPHELQHARPPCPSPRAYPNSWLLSWWCLPTISSSVIPFSLLPSIFPSIRVFSNEFALHRSNRQVWSWSTKRSRAKANRDLPRECTGHSKHPLPITQEKTLHMDITRWSTLKSDWLILCSQRWRSSIQSAKTRPEADCGSDHELLISKFRLKFKTVGKTTRPFRYDLNQIPYDYTVEVTNRFKGLNLVDRVPEELWMEICNILTGGGD